MKICLEPSAKWGPAEPCDRLDYERILNGNSSLSLKADKSNLQSAQEGTDATKQGELAVIDTKPNNQGSLV